MPSVSNVDCIYLTNSDGTCHKKFNRGKECVSYTGRRCGHKRLNRTSTPVFDDEKWHWKSNMHTLSLALSNLFYGEQAKFHDNEKGDAHAKRRMELGHYPFIMRDMNNVISMVTHARKHFGHRRRTEPKPKFLDCGCGVGNVVLMAHFAGFDAYGIEYDSVTLQRGRRLLKQFRVNPKKLFQGDILEYPNYADYDVLYGYCPMCDRDKEDAFESKVRLDMKIGALLWGIGWRKSEKIGKERVYFQRLILGPDAVSSIKVAHEKD
jgi:SAM-dependent methyltransferase